MGEPASIKTDCDRQNRRRKNKKEEEKLYLEEEKIMQLVVNIHSKIRKKGRHIFCHFPCILYSLFNSISQTFSKTSSC